METCTAISPLGINERRRSTMDMDMLRMLEDQSKILKTDKSTLLGEMLLFCRMSDDPVAQDISHRLDVIEAAWDALSTDVDKLQLMYEHNTLKEQSGGCHA